MALHATAKFENVAASVATYARDFLETARGHAIRFPGDAFDASKLAAWFDLDVSPGPGRFHRQVAEDFLGATETALVRLEAKVRRDATEETYRRWRMADDAWLAFALGKEIAFADYASGPPYASLGALKVRALAREDGGERAGLLIARVHARLEYRRLASP